MTREEQALRRDAEAFVKRVLKNYAHWKQLAENTSACKIVGGQLEPGEEITFRDLSEMRSWLIDIKNVRKAVNDKERYDVFTLVGDHLYVGLTFEKMATLRRSSIDATRTMYWRGVASIFVELCSRGIDEEYCEGLQRNVA